MAWPIPVPTPAVSEVAKTIQLVVAPVFVLAGIGTLLNVLTGRLSRVVDRARVLEDRFPSAGDEETGWMRTELHILDRRMSIVNVAIFLCTASGCSICLLVGLMFVSDVAELRFGRAVAALFILAMAMLMLGLLTFLVEVRVAMKAVRIRPELLGQDR